LDLKIIVPDTDFISMKKYLLIAVFFCLTTAICILLYATDIFGILDDTVKDAVRLEDSIIIQGIQMESDVPISDNATEAEGKIIYDDTFEDVTDFKVVKKQSNSDVTSKVDMKEFNRLRLKDQRWHLCRYKIKKMDNLWRIARRFGVDHRLIISVNGINDPDMLKPGRYIHVPSLNGVSYQVKKGDTISAIAGRYRIAGRKIIAHNQLSGKPIHPGQKLFLPDARELVVRHAATYNQKRETAVMTSDLKNFVWPMEGKITSGFGNRTDPLSGQRRFHCGIDISANSGMPIHAVSDGRVIFSGWKPGYGNVVIIRHNGGYISVYAHNSKNLIPVDETVGRGETIAYSGMTGAVTGAHLHFELRKYVTPLNPMRILQ
jgi:murein DD-endopeptidase MepM/ murein hydrolase activator NlpD